MTKTQPSSFAAALISAEGKHCVADHDAVDADVHAVRPGAQRGCGQVVVVLAALSPELRVPVTTSDQCSARSSRQRDSGRQ